MKNDVIQFQLNVSSYFGSIRSILSIRFWRFIILTFRTHTIQPSTLQLFSFRTRKIKLPNLNSHWLPCSCPSTLHIIIIVEIPQHSIELLLMRRQRTVSFALALVTRWFGVFSVFCLHVRAHHHRRITPRVSASHSFFFHGFIFFFFIRRWQTTQRNSSRRLWFDVSVVCVLQESVPVLHAW